MLYYTFWISFQNWFFSLNYFIDLYQLSMLELTNTKFNYFNS
jgi:hypothetical protein